MTVTMIRVMIALGIIGHAINMYCDRILSIFPRGTIKFDNIKEIEKDGVLAAYTFERSRIPGAVMFVAISFSCIAGAAYHVKCGFAEYVFLQLGRDRTARDMMLDLSGLIFLTAIKFCPEVTILLYRKIQTPWMDKKLRMAALCEATIRFYWAAITAQRGRVLWQ